MDVPRPVRAINPASKLTDTANAEAPQLLFQCKAVQDFHSRHADKSAHASASSTTASGADSNVPSSASATVPTPQNKRSISSLAEDGIVNQPVPCMSSPHPSFISDFGTFLTAKKKCTQATKSQVEGRDAASDTADDVNMMDSEDIHAEGIVFLARDVRQLIAFVCGLGKKMKNATLGNPLAVDADRFLVDVNVQEVDGTPTLSTREDKRQDVDHFFHTAVVKEVNGKLKKYRTCKSCPWVLALPFHHVY